MMEAERLEIIRSAEIEKRELFEENQKLRQELDRSSGTIVTEFEREREEWRKKYPLSIFVSLSHSDLALYIYLSP